MVEEKRKRNIKESNEIPNIELKSRAIQLEHEQYQKRQDIVKNLVIGGLLAALLITNQIIPTVATITAIVLLVTMTFTIAAVLCGSDYFFSKLADKE